MPGIDELIRCGFCNSTLKDPYVLPCYHAGCKACLVGNTSSGKITCKSCGKAHQVASGSVEKAFKPHTLGAFFLNVKTDNFASVQQDGQPTEIEGVCTECTPQPKKQDPNAPPPPNVKLSTCFHCNKPICEKCRNKHYDLQRKDTLKNLDKFDEGSFSVKTTTEQLNELRKKKIGAYGKLKTEVSAKHQEYIEKLKHEEEKLYKEIDEEIKFEELKIKQSEHDLVKVAANQDTAKTVKQKVGSENDVKRLASMCLAIATVQMEWTNSLKNEVSKADPSKEMKLVYNAPKIKDGILGGFDQKKAGGNVKQASIPGEKSSVCTIL